MKRPLALFFPGQGGQYVGMAGDLPAPLEKTVKELFDFDLLGLCRQGPAEELKKTAYAQPAIVLHSLALWEKVAALLAAKDLRPSVVLGHSVGEYSALAVAQALRYEDALRLVHRRGQAMQKAVPAGQGKMLAVLKQPHEILEKACQQASQKGEEVVCANYNGPDQVVISGHVAACHRAVSWLEDHIEGRLRVIELKVSAPFHSPLMKEAEKVMATELHQQKIEIAPLATDYVANVNAKRFPAGTPADVIRENLIQQICGSVRWEQSVAQLPNETLCLEIGPGKVLTGLAKKINPKLEAVAVDGPDWREKIEAL